jgi:hypothetical protein
MPPVLGPVSSSPMGLWSWELVFADGLVVLGTFHDINTAAIDKRQNRRFLAEQFVLNDHGVAGGTEDAVFHDLLGGQNPFGRFIADKHTLALGQTGGLDHDGLVAAGDVGLGILKIRK